jgi:hypothetical protein
VRLVEADVDALALGRRHLLPRDVVLPGRDPLRERRDRRRSVVFVQVVEYLPPSPVLQQLEDEVLRQGVTAVFDRVRTVRRRKAALCL